MPDETPTPDATTTPVAATAEQPAAAPAQPALTLEAVNAMIEAATQKAFNSGAAAARREEQSKQAKQSRTETKPDTPAAAQPDALAILALRDAFDDATGDLQLTASQKRFLRERVMKERPDDVASYVTGAIEALGITRPAQAQPATQPAASTSATPQQPKPTVPATPAPAVVPDREGEPAFRALSEDAARDMWQAYVRRKGADPGNPYSPRNRAVWRELRNRFNAEAATASIRLGARRG